MKAKIDKSGVLYLQKIPNVGLIKQICPFRMPADRECGIFCPKFEINLNEIYATGTRKPISSSYVIRFLCGFIDNNQIAFNKTDVDIEWK